MEACATFQSPVREDGCGHQSFKTVNGMEACATVTSHRYPKLVQSSRFQNRKRYGGMRDSSPKKWLRNAVKIGLLESVLQSGDFRLRSPKKLSVEFHKSLEFVELARSFRFGKCFV